MCDRCDKNEEFRVLKKKISQHLENTYYVPVLRAEDNSMMPVIGEPFSAGNTSVSFLCYISSLKMKAGCWDIN